MERLKLYQKDISYSWSDRVFEVEVGWCEKHEYPARRHPDGSWSCWWEDIVEADGDHHDHDFLTIGEALGKGFLRLGEEE